MKKRLLIVVLDLLLILYVGLSTKWFTDLNGELTSGASILIILFISSPTIYIVLEAISKRWETYTLKNNK